MLLTVLVVWVDDIAGSVAERLLSLWVDVAGNVECWLVETTGGDESREVLLELVSFWAFEVKLEGNAGAAVEDLSCPRVDVKEPLGYSHDFADVVDELRQDEAWRPLEIHVLDDVVIRLDVCAREAIV